MRARGTIRTTIGARLTAAVLVVVLVVSPLLAAPARRAEAQVAEAYAAATIVVPTIGTLTGAAAAPWIAAALVTVAVVGGGAYCLTETDCVAHAQSFWTASSSWMATYMQSVIASGANTMKWSSAAGYSQADLLSAYAAAYAAGGQVLHYDAGAYAGQLSAMDAVTLPSVSRTVSTNVATVSIPVPGPTFVDQTGTTRALLGIGLTLPDGTVTTGTASGLRWVKNSVAAPTSWSNLSTAVFEDAAADVVNAVQTSAVTQIDDGNGGALTQGVITWNEIALRVQSTATQQAMVPGFWYRWCYSRSFSCTSYSAWTYVPPSAFTYTQPSKATAPTPGSDPDHTLLVLGAGALGLGALAGAAIYGRTTTAETRDGQTSTLANPGVVNPTDAGSQASQLGWLSSIYTRLGDVVDGIAAIPSAIADGITDGITDAIEAAFVPTVSVSTRWTAVYDMWAVLPPFSLVSGLSSAVDTFGAAIDQSPEDACIVWEFRTYEWTACLLPAWLDPILVVFRAASTLAVGILVWQYLVGWARRFGGGE